jgi:hypothetical protein
MSTLLQEAPAVLTEAPGAKAEKAQESSHYYELIHGEWAPLYTPEKSFTLREARKAKKEGRTVAPSVTTYFKCLHKQFLLDWKVEMAVKVAAERAAELYSTRITKEEFVESVINEASHSSRGAMDLGTNIHTAIEQATAGQDYDAAMQVYVEPAMAVRRAEGLVSVSVEECVGSVERGYAGRCDEFFSGMIVGDNKSRKTRPGKKVATYETDACQLAAYGYAKFGGAFFEGASDRGGVIFVISTSEPGRVEPVWFTRAELYEAWLGFESLTGVWRYINSFDPRK